jgi:hypothetical protein
MARRPLGEIAMTEAQRQQRRRDQLRPWSVRTREDAAARARSLARLRGAWNRASWEERRAFIEWAGVAKFPGGACWGDAISDLMGYEHEHDPDAQRRSEEDWRSLYRKAG